MSGIRARLHTDLVVLLGTLAKTTERPGQWRFGQALGLPHPLKTFDTLGRNVPLHTPDIVDIATLLTASAGVNYTEDIDLI